MSPLVNSELNYAPLGRNNKFSNFAFFEFNFFLILILNITELIIHQPISNFYLQSEVTFHHKYYRNNLKIASSHFQ